MICKNCNANIPDSSAFCSVCGTAVISEYEDCTQTEYCPRCGRKLPVGDSICPTCGRNKLTNERAVETERIRKSSQKRIVVTAFVVFAFLLLMICSNVIRSLSFLVAVIAIPIILVLLIIRTIQKKPKKSILVYLVISILIIAFFGVTNEHAQSGFENGYKNSTGKTAIVGKWEGNSLAIYDQKFFPIEDDMEVSFTVKSNGTATMTIDGESKKYRWEFNQAKTEYMNQQLDETEPDYLFYDMEYADSAEELEAVLVGDHMVVTLNPNGKPISWGFERNS